MIDITMTIKEDMKVYKNKAENKPQFVSNTSGYVHQSNVKLDLHTGSHVDFPLHMIPGGKSSDDYPLSYHVGKCYVKDATYLNHRLLKRDLQAINLSNYDFILFKTRNSSSEIFNPDFIYVSEEAADYLAEFDLKGVGIDGLGIERAQEGHPTHVKLLSRDILIYEGLDLSQVEEGVYEFIGLPLKLQAMEASPIRALLR